MWLQRKKEKKMVHWDGFWFRTSSEIKSWEADRKKIDSNWVDIELGQKDPKQRGNSLSKANGQADGNEKYQKQCCEHLLFCPGVPLQSYFWKLPSLHACVSLNSQVGHMTEAEPDWCPLPGV